MRVIHLYKNVGLVVQVNLVREIRIVLRISVMMYYEYVYNPQLEVNVRLIEIVLAKDVTVKMKMMELLIHMN